MHRVYLNLLTAVCLTFAPFAAPLAMAQSQSTDIRPHASRMMDIDLKASFTGQTHSGAYNFTSKGEPTKFYEERHNKDGSVAYSEGSSDEVGIWRVIKNKLCYLYDSDQMSGGCFRVYRVTNCYYFYSDRLIEREDELDRDYWTARSTIKGEPPECDAALS